MRSHHRRQHHLPYLGWPTGIPPPPSQALNAWLSMRPTVRPLLMRRPSELCRICGTPIEPGDTAWEPVIPRHMPTGFCDRCGRILALHSDAWTLRDLLHIPPIGGPPPTSPAYGPIPRIRRETALEDAL